MADYNGVSRLSEVENMLAELLDLWHQGILTIADDVDYDGILIVNDIVRRAQLALDGELDVEVELEGQSE